MLRQALLTVAASSRAKQLVSVLPVSSGIVARFVAGESVEQAVDVTLSLIEHGLHVSLDHLGEYTHDPGRAAANRDAYLTLLDRLGYAGLTGGAEVSLKLSAVGQALPGNGEQLALENARTVCESARSHGTTVTLDMEDHTTTDSTLRILRELRRDFPDVGVVLQSYLHRTESDCRELATAGSRVRLCKGAYKEPASVAYQSKRDVDRSYVRCLRILMAGEGYPMVATHDPRLVAITAELAVQYGRAKGTYEYQMLYGIRPDEQRRLTAMGERVRVYVPYGADWYGYLVRRLAERPANMAFFLRSLATKS
ncbi:MAG: proline dehydrogenase family protein [Actinomycetota bacterium]|nr:proline dehydrogenase family protein [Actinomycetota bacterium]